MGWLALCLLCGELSTGCLVPQDDHVLQGLPQINHPPRIVEDGVSPQSRVISTDTSCPPIEFSAPVEDPDLGDLIFVNWYFSDLTTNTAPLQPDKTDSIQNATGQTLRKDPASVLLGFAQGSPLHQPGVHVIELMVSDGAVVNRVPQPRDVALDGGVGTLTYASTYVWIVNVTDTGVCP